MSEQPTVGRIVHWVEDFGEPCQAAIVVGRNDGPLTEGPMEPDLAVFVASRASDYPLVGLLSRPLSQPGRLTTETPPRWSDGWHWPRECELRP